MGELECVREIHSGRSRVKNIASNGWVKEA